jgi:hypothetical protein
MAEEKTFYANGVLLNASESEAVLIFKVGWPEHIDPEEAREVCRVYVPKSLLDAMMRNWPAQIAEAERIAREAMAANQADNQGGQYAN